MKEEDGRNEEDERRPMDRIQRERKGLEERKETARGRTDGEGG